MCPDVLIKSIPVAELQAVAALLPYSRDGIAQRILSDNEGMTIVLMAICSGRRFDVAPAPGEAMLQILEGRLDVDQKGAKSRLQKGGILILPAREPSRLQAVDHTKALLTTIRQPDKIAFTEL